MAYDEQLAQRVRAVFFDEPDMTEMKMFGGLAFMVDGHMACGIIDDKLMLRLGAEGGAAALRRKHVHPMDFTGKPMAGFVYVEPAGLRGAALGTWVGRARDFVATLPRKAPKKRRHDAESA